MVLRSRFYISHNVYCPKCDFLEHQHFASLLFFFAIETNASRCNSVKENGDETSGNRVANHCAAAPRCPTFAQWVSGQPPRGPRKPEHTQRCTAGGLSVQRETIRPTVHPPSPSVKDSDCDRAAAFRCPEPPGGPGDTPMPRFSPE